MFKPEENIDHEKRRAAFIGLVSGAPARVRPNDADISLLADLTIHALDDTMKHMFDHVERARPSFTDRNSEVVMTMMLLHLVAARADKTSNEIGAIALHGLKAMGYSAEELERLRREAEG